jgi:hypothetical protein
MKYERTPLSEIMHKYGISGVHPYLEIIPEAADETFQRVCADVDKNGFLHPIMIDDEDMLIDGRMRPQIGWVISLDPPKHCLQIFNLEMRSRLSSLSDWVRSTTRKSA